MTRGHENRDENLHWKERWKMSKKNADQTTQDMTKERSYFSSAWKAYQYREGGLNVDSRNCLVQDPDAIWMRRVALHRRRRKTCKSRGWFGAPAHFRAGYAYVAFDLPEVTNHKDRLKYPMKRAKEDRGKDKWERNNLGRAIDICCTELERLRQEYGPKSVFVCERHRAGSPAYGTI